MAEEVAEIFSKHIFSSKYEDLSEEENSEVKKIYPLKLVETVKEN